MTLTSLTSLIPNSSAGPSCAGPSSPSSSLALAKRQQPGALTSAADKAVSKNAAKNIPAFLTKLFTMVNDPSTDHLIKWGEPHGDSFFVVSSEKFGRELLPKYFKHSNFGSFVRQLNMYGFHKVPHMNQGVLQGDLPETEMLEFSNPHFQRGQPDMLCFIQRKKSSPESSGPPGPPANAENSESNAPAAASTIAHFDLQSVMAEVASIRKHQTLLSSDLKTLQSSNGHLWQEAIASRERTKRCQDTITKILAFLAQVFGGRISGLNNPSRANSIPRTDIHRARSGESREKHNLGFNSPSPGLSVVNRSRQPRLMLEDARRFSERSPYTSVENQVSSKLSNEKILQDLAFDPEALETLNGFSPPRAFSSPNLQEREAEHGLHSSSDCFTRSSGSSRDNTLDPDLEPGRPDYSKCEESITDGGPSDKSASDAIFQAIFNDSSFNSGYNAGEELFPKINWMELLNGKDSNPFGYSNSSSHSPPQSMRPPSPLRITDGQNSLKSPSIPPHAPPSTSGLSPRTKTVFDLQSQTDGINGASGKFESLEAAIERLVGSLPQVTAGPSAELNLGNQIHAENHDSLVGTSISESTDSKPHQGHPFDADAFIKTLAGYNLCSDSPHLESFLTWDNPVHPGNIAPTPKISSNCDSDKFSSASVGEPSHVSFSNSVVALPSPQLEDRCDPLDLDRILNEWTSEDSVPLASPLTVSPEAINSRTITPEAKLSPEILSGNAQSSVKRFHMDEKESRPGIFDINDDDHLRRIMSKKPNKASNNSHQISNQSPNTRLLSEQSFCTINQSPIFGTVASASESFQPGLLKKRLVDDVQQNTGHKKIKQ
ncbi:hypothetical protein BY996DRAFT_4573040 [Phakopsora pachyrhizi]|nr:hypothetical protein BY996DRAFT_4573040 [Phakopsora pachyrhizi]